MKRYNYVQIITLVSKKISKWCQITNHLFELIVESENDLLFSELATVFAEEKCHIFGKKHVFHLFSVYM